ncbi:hypothetical protein [Ensifer aridi]|uniref:hypothetical protein n=1 Tax=Ensifer aridi TaxID=1708715 RepID=UPI001AECC060
MSQSLTMQARIASFARFSDLSGHRSPLTTALVVAWVQGCWKASPLCTCIAKGARNDAFP